MVPMLKRNRRDFLLLAGSTLAGAAAFPRWSAASATIPAQQRIRGVMVDAARVPESPEYYRRVIEFCSDWELNTLHFRLTDDQGTAMRFTTVPNLITHADALTPDQMRSLVEYGNSHGVDLLPEVEAFGHTGYITRSPAYAHLLDADPNGSSEFTGIIPVHPETPELMATLFREVASVFPSKYLHGGCDEVNWGGSALSRKALASKSRAQIWADYLNTLNDLVQDQKKELIVWGDFVLHKEPEILGRLNKNIVIMDWNYWDTSALAFHDALMKVKVNGSRGIGAPGLISYRWGPRPGSEQLRNIDAFAEAYFDADDSGSLGAILTNWVPCRYIQNSLWDGFAYAAAAFKDGPAQARITGLRRFVERHYGAHWNEQWDEAFRLLYDAAPEFGSNESASPLGLHLPVPFSNEQHLAALLTKRAAQANPFPRLRGTLVALKPAVKKNTADFEALALSVEYLDTLLWRESVILERSAGKRIDREAARALIQHIAARDRRLAGKLSRDWDRGRSPKSAAITGPLYGMQAKDQLVWQWQQAAAFSAGLAVQPERFHGLLQKAGLAA